MQSYNHHVGYVVLEMMLESNGFPYIIGFLGDRSTCSDRLDYSIDIIRLQPLLFQSMITQTDEDRSSVILRQFVLNPPFRGILREVLVL